MKSNRSILPTMLAWSACMGPMSADLLVDIFKRLPIQTLARFRCVCRSWNSLISSTLFINLQHSFTSDSAFPPNLKPYLVVRGDLYSLRRPQESVLKHHKQDVYFPFECRTRVEDLDYYLLRDLNFNFVDVINGVVCVSLSLESAFDSTILWNPAVYKYVVLPWIPFPLDLETAKHNFIDAAESMGVMDFIDDVKERFIAKEAYFFVRGTLCDCSVIGFGYDNSKNDFKVVRIWMPSDEFASCCGSILPTYELYSAQEGTWRVATADNLKSCRFLDKCEVGINKSCFLNGTIHWIVHDPRNRSSRSVLMFDCECEEFKTVELPREILGVSLRVERTELLEFAGMLAVAMKRCDRFYTETLVELWVMEEHGVATTWNKLYRFQGAFGFSVYQPSFEELAPYGPKQWNKFRSNGSIHKKYNRILSAHIYEESMFLMDWPTTQSYTNAEIVPIYFK